MIAKNVIIFRGKLLILHLHLHNPFLQVHCTINNFSITPFISISASDNLNKKGSKQIGSYERRLNKFKTEEELSAFYEKERTRKLIERQNKKILKLEAELAGTTKTPPYAVQSGSEANIIAIARQVSYMTTAMKCKELINFKIKKKTNAGEIAYITEEIKSLSSTTLTKAVFDLKLTEATIIASLGPNERNSKKRTRETYENEQQIIKRILV